MCYEKGLGLRFKLGLRKINQGCGKGLGLWFRVRVKTKNKGYGEGLGLGFESGLRETGGDTIICLKNAVLLKTTLVSKVKFHAPNLKPEMLFSWIKMKRFLIQFKSCH